MGVYRISARVESQPLGRRAGQDAKAGIGWRGFAGATLQGCPVPLAKREQSANRSSVLMESFRSNSEAVIEN